MIRVMHVHEWFEVIFGRLGGASGSFLLVLGVVLGILGGLGALLVGLETILGKYAVSMSS